MFYARTLHVSRCTLHRLQVKVAARAKRPRVTFSQPVRQTTTRGSKLPGCGSLLAKVLQLPHHGMMAVGIVNVVVAVDAAGFDGFALTLFWPIGFYICMYVKLFFMWLLLLSSSWWWPHSVLAAFAQFNLRNYLRSAKFVCHFVAVVATIVVAVVVAVVVYFLARLFRLLAALLFAHQKQKLCFFPHTPLSFPSLTLSLSLSLSFTLSVSVVSHFGLMLSVRSAHLHAKWRTVQKGEPHCIWGGNGLGPM